jgi:hypothetical protein
VGSQARRTRDGVGLSIDVGRAAAQIAAMFRIFAILVRTNYLVAVLVALVFLTPWLFDGVVSLFRPGFVGNVNFWRTSILLLVLAGFVAPAARALFRLVRRASLIPDSHLREAPVVATLVLFASAFASFLFLNLAWAFLTRAGRDVELAPFAFFGLFWLAIALLTGEIVLVGRQKKGTDLFIDAPADRGDADGIVNK